MSTELQVNAIYMINDQQYTGAYLMKAVQVYEKELNRKKAYAKQKYVPKKERIADKQNGLIYSIRSPSTDKIYIGSTTQSLQERFTRHKSCCKEYSTNKKKYISSFEIIKFGDAYIEEYEQFPCEDLKLLRTREAEIIKEMADKVVNKVSPVAQEKLKSPNNTINVELVFQAH